MEAFKANMGALDPDAIVTNVVLFRLVTALTDTMKEEFASAIEKKNREIQGLNTLVNDLTTKIDNLEQYTRRNSIRVSGLPERIDENTNTTIIRMAAEKLQVRLEERDIDRSHRLGRKMDDGRPREIIVKLVSHDTKVNILKSGKRLRGTNIYMNEDMTKYRSSLAFEARQLKRDKQIADTWTRDGHILIKNKAGNIKSISTKQELSLLISALRA